jgi:hypothetical protein
MLPEYLMRHGDLSEAKKWSLAIIEAGFAILQNIITVTNSQAKYAGLKLNPVFKSNKLIIVLK